MNASSPRPEIRPRATTRRRVRGFTLTELLIVVALIAVLVGLLLAALSQVQEKSRKTVTIATIESFRNACEAFRQDHGFYPGVVPEGILIADAQANGGIPKFSGTENALLHLMGGFAREEDDPAQYANLLLADGWQEFSFDDGVGGTYRVKVATGLIGDGPVVGGVPGGVVGKPYPPYLTPGDREIGIVKGQVGVVLDANDVEERPRIPELLDAWGQPIVYVRRLRPIGPLVDDGSGLAPQFVLDPANSYLDSPALGGFGEDQQFRNVGSSARGSILSPACGFRNANLSRLIVHPALGDAQNAYATGEAQGAYLVMSAGADGVYFSAIDGPGSSEDNDFVEDLAQHSLQKLVEFDDVVVFGGS